jgi:hypothetical protein
MTDFEVRLTETRGERMLTEHVTNLSFTSVDGGGFGSASFDLDQAIDAEDFERHAEIAIFDTETEEQVGGGRMQRPGRGLSSRGEVWKCDVIGEGPAHLAEREVPFCQIDTRLEEGGWTKRFTTNRRLQWAQGNQPDDDNVPGWTFTIEAGALNSGYVGRLTHAVLEECAKIGGSDRIEIAAYEFTYDCGNGTNENRIQSYLSTTGGLEDTQITDHGFAVSPLVRHREITTNWPSGGIGPFSDDPPLRLTIRYLRNSPSVTVGGDDDWMHVSNLRVTALRLDKNRNPITTGPSYNFDYVLPHEAIIDSWARFCPRLDLANARIATTATFQHRDLVWPDGIHPLGELKQIMEYNPAFTWAVWDKQYNGLWRAEWRERDTDVRYDIVADEGFDQTGETLDELDAAYVTAEAATGAYRVLSFGDDVSNLDHIVSRTIRHSGKLDDTSWSEVADALGNDTIEQSQLAAAAAKVTVSGFVFDRFTGRWVKPYQVLPGYVCSVIGVGYDGATSYRVVSNAYSVDEKSSSLELDWYTLDEQRAIAALVQAVAA